MAATLIRPASTEVVAVPGTESAYARFCQLLEQASGITLGEHKDYLVQSRLAPVLQEHGYSGLGELVAALERPGATALRNRVVDAMTTNETLWFRDGSPFDILRDTLLPARAAQRGGPMRIWSAACSTGQEPYSISMVVSEYLAGNPGALPGGVEVVGTDISPTVLKQAGAASYDRFDLARGLSEERKARWFTATGERFVLREEVRRRVVFRELNLLGSYAALGRFDVVFCRNVLIYFAQPRKCDILARIARQLQPRGYLFLGGSEPLANHSDAFEMVRMPRGVVYRLKA